MLYINLRPCCSLHPYSCVAKQVQGVTVASAGKGRWVEEWGVNNKVNLL